MTCSEKWFKKRNYEEPEMEVIIFAEGVMTSDAATASPNDDGIIEDTEWDELDL